MAPCAILLVSALFAALDAAAAFKFLAYNPLTYHSHVNYMSKISDALVDAGHEVVMLVPRSVEHITSVGAKKVQRIIEVPQSAAAAAYEREYLDDDAGTRMMMAGRLDMKMISAISRCNEAWAEQCNLTLHYPGLLEQLKAEHFDAAFGEALDSCGVGLYHTLGIEKYAIVQSIPAIEGYFSLTGAPTVPSYIPGLIASYGDRMSFFERLQNTFMAAVTKLAIPQMSSPYERVLSAFLQDIPPLMELYGKASLWFINSEPLIDFPKITIHKVVDIGGISASAVHKPVNETWNKILSLRPRTVLISFGTVCKGHLLPAEFKVAIRAAAARLPNVTFIWKYERPEDNVGKGIDNMIIVGWMPQNDLLRDGRLSLFVTHGGAGSIFEGMAAGLPLLLVPIFGDQNRNVQLPQRAGTGLLLSKEKFGNPDALVGALKELLEHDKYRKAALRTAKMLADRPFSMRQTLVRHMEFLAEYGPLRNLDHYGSQLSFIQYYLIDVIAFTGAMILFVLLVFLFVLRCALRSCWRRVFQTKTKGE